MSEQYNPQEAEIALPEKCAFIAKTRAAAPYRNQPIDYLGSYETRFERDDGYVSIYVPVLAEEGADKEGLIDNKVRVVVRHEDELSIGLVICKSEHYTVDMVTGEPDYDETVRVHDARTGARISSEMLDDPQAIIDMYSIKASLFSRVFSRKRFDEVMPLLDELLH